MKRDVFFWAFVFFWALKASPYNVHMTGDSHVCSKIYPERVGDILVDADPEIYFSYWGKIGATVNTFNSNRSFMDKIYEAKPEILIVHLGTNDSYSHHFNEAHFKEELTEFYNNVKEHCPECKMVFVTPFFNRLKDGTVNHNTRLCADAYLDFATAHDNVYVVDNNAQYGMFFLHGGAELIRHDGVHLTVEGYEELGDQVGQGLIDIDDLWVWSE